MREDSPESSFPLTLLIEEERAGERRPGEGGGGLGRGEEVCGGGYAAYLFSQRPPRGLAVGSEEHGLWILGSQLFLHQVGPESPCCPHLSYLHVEVHPYAPEEGEAWSKLVYVNPCIDA